MEHLLLQETYETAFKITPQLVPIDEPTKITVTPDPDSIQFILDPQALDTIVRAKKISPGVFRVDFSLYEPKELKLIICMVKTPEKEQIISCKLVDNHIKISQ